VTANTTSAGQTFTVVNNASSSPVNIGLSMVGSQPANFPMSTTCGSSLAGGASCTVTVAFSPTAVASYGAAVQVSYSYPRMQGGQATSYYPSTANFSVPVTGTGAGAIATLTSAAAQSIGWQGSINVTYRNDGGMAMTLTAPTMTTPLSLSSNNCSGIAPGSSCTMVIADNTCCYTGTVTFVPTGTATPPATTSINYSVPGIVGRWSTTSLNFGTVNVGSSVSQNVQLYNDGSQSVDWTHSSPFLQGLPSGFSAVATGSSAGGGNCIAIVSGQYCNFAMTFAPTTGGAVSGSNVQSENTLTFSGVGNAPTPAPFTSSSPTTTSVTGGRTGTWTFTNPNSFAAKVTAVGVTVTPSSMSYDVSIGGTCASATVAAGGTCTVTVSTVADCTAYTATPTVTDGGGTTTGTGSLSQPKTTNTKSCS
jgi:hypothetical protein